MLWAYVGRLLRSVFRPRFTSRDAAALILGLAVLPCLWLIGGQVFEFIQAVGLELLAGLIFVALLRVAAAPYRVWRAQIAYIRELHRELDGRTS
jgi:hypothetical protein